MRAILGALLVVLLLVVVVMLFGTWSGGSRGNHPPATGTTGTINTDRARERGAQIGEKAAIATQKIEETAHEAALTTKIKAKMALDDSVHARAIDVTTNGAVVTLSGTVRSMAERERALALARETYGVTKVVDRLEIRP